LTDTNNPGRAKDSPTGWLIMKRKIEENRRENVKEVRKTEKQR
jgi:hypothetical protein